MPGKFITIEGTEGAGKSTVMQYIRYYLDRANIDTIWTREPGGTVLAEEMRKLVLHTPGTEKVEPETELLLMFAGRAQHLKNVILPALDSGKWVISDRFIDASYAYQGGGRGIDTQYIAELDKWIVNENYPDLTFLLDIPPEQGLERTERRGVKDRIEQEKLDFFIRVRKAYLQRAEKYPERIKIIDAGVRLHEVEKQIKQVLDVFCNTGK